MALEIFFLQYRNNEVYRKYINSIRIAPETIHSIEKIPFLPISLFKTHKVVTTIFEPEITFESSGTTGENTSRHFVKDFSLYSKSFSKGFNIFYGDPSEWCVLGLLPGYLERQNSSLVAMVNELIQKSDNSYSGFYLHDHEKLYQALVHNEIMRQPTLLIGVTYALLDFAEKYQMSKPNIIRHVLKAKCPNCGKGDIFLNKKVFDELRFCFLSYVCGVIRRALFFAG